MPRLSSRSILIYGLMLLALCGGLVGCAKEWMVSKGSGCKLYDAHPVAGQTFEWQGACQGGYASGYGTLWVYEQGQARFRCEGFMEKGRLDGQVFFAVYDQAGVLESVYEEQWRAGRRARRLRNSSLEQRLADASDARAYLHLLKQYIKEHPKAWMDPIHKAMAERTVFAGNNLTISTPVNQLPPHDAKLSDATGTHQTGAVLKGELLFKIYDSSSSSSHSFYTLYRHRPSALKSLLSGKYNPGGRQFYTRPPFAMLAEGQVPDTLPERYAPMATTAASAPQWITASPPAGDFWYPLAKP